MIDDIYNVFYAEPKLIGESVVAINNDELELLCGARWDALQG